MSPGGLLKPASSETGRRTRRPVFWRMALFLITCLSLPMLSGCNTPMNEPSSAEPRRDINEVLRAHEKELMSLPGVVGLYVGLMPDGKTMCLRVMLARPDPTLERQLPQALEGYPLITEVTGPIRPMDGR